MPAQDALDFGSERPELSVVIPVFNEEALIDELYSRVTAAAESWGHDFEVLVVNDGSRDGTARGLARFPWLQVVTHETNRGYGAALCSAFEFARQHNYDALVTIDCDGQHEPQLIPEFVAACRSRCRRRCH